MKSFFIFLLEKLSAHRSHVAISTIGLLLISFANPLSAQSQYGYKLGSCPLITCYDNAGLCPECVYPTIVEACQSYKSLGKSGIYTNTYDYHTSEYCIYKSTGPDYSGTISISVKRVSDACPAGQHRANLLCVKDEGDKNAGGGNCGNGKILVGNPINAGFGNKYQQEIDISSASSNGLTLSRHYNGFTRRPPPILMQRWGWNWRGTYDRAIAFTSTETATVYRPDGREETFNYTVGSGLWQADADINARLEPFAGGWRYRNLSDDTIELYDASGRLLSITHRNGTTLTMAYSDGTAGANGGYYYSTSGVITTSVLPAGLLLSVTDSFGHSFKFGYGANNNVVRVTDAASALYRYSYNSSSNNLSSVTYPDGKSRAYAYNEQIHTSNTQLPYALTGINDENGARFSVFKYDNLGRAIMTWRVGGERYSIAYTSDTNGNVTSSAVTDALGTTRTYSFTTILGVVKNTGVTQPCSSGCGTASATTYDANGNVASKTDFNGNVTTYLYDLSRNLETARTEAAGTALARTITTAWHADYRLPTLITEPGKTTSFNYDASGNLLSKTITDTNLNQSRTWNWTYNSLGQVLTADGPRTDVNDVTTYTYYSSASNVAGSVHSIGDLATVTNAAGHVTSITHYDLNGRPLSITDPNGVVTTLEYWPRGWLKTRTVNGVQTTQYDYDGVGQLIKVTLPDGSYLSYTYDTAHRLTDIADGSVSGGLSGNKIHYTLDAMGNRTQEDTSDPGNNILKTRARVFDALNRLQKDIGGTSPTTQITQYAYDNNGNLQTITDPLNHVTTNGYDALNRLITVTDPANGVSTTSYNALDQITQVKDPRLVTTDYTLNALGDITLTQSPDSGDTHNAYDAAGNVIQKTDARGVVSNYTYDALNRLTGIAYPANTAENVSFHYDDATAPYSKGRLSSVATNNGGVGFIHDAYGNATQQFDLSPTLWSFAHYQYDSANRLSRITYPSGRIVTYTRNGLGQITQVQTQDNAGAATHTIIGNATYEPFGPLKSLTFGNGVTTTLQHDADYRVGRITTTSTPGWDYVYGYDAAGNLTGLTDQLGSANKGYGYDALNRVVTDNNADSANFTYQYDAGGNRTALNFALYAVTQTYGNNSNRQTAFAGTATPLDAAGNLTARTNIAAMSYNNANRLSQATVGGLTTHYQYTGLGQRNLKTGAQPTHYDYLPDGKTLSQTQLNSDNSYNQGVDYIWLDDVPVAQIKTTYAANNTPGTRRTTYIHADHLNTPRIMTDSTKTVVWKWSGDAYGGLIAPNTNPDGDSTSDTLDLRFPGQIADSETGLYYNMNRYYDPMSGRYTQSDPIGLVGGLNTYGYVNGNPISFTDPTGLIVGVDDAAVIVAGTAALSAGAACIASNCGQKAVDAIKDAAKKLCGDNDDDKDCNIVLDKSQLKAAGIRGKEHEVKADELGTNKNLSKFDLCGCKDGRVVLKAHGCQGPIISVTDYRWK